MHILFFIVTILDLELEVHILNRKYIHNWILLVNALRIKISID